MEILFDEFGFTIDTEWFYLTINKWLFVTLIISFVAYKIYKKYFVKTEKLILETEAQKSIWE